MKWHLLIPALVCLHSTCLVVDTTFYGSQPITEETIANLCDAFPNNFVTARNSLEILEAIREPQEASRDIEKVVNPSTERCALYLLARAVLGLTKAEVTLSDAELRQDQARLKLGTKDRAEVLKLVSRADAMFERMGLDHQALKRIAALRLF